MAGGKELTNSQKRTEIVKLWKEGIEKLQENVRQPEYFIYSISSFIARHKKLKTVENQRRTAAPGKFLRDLRGS